nr:unnamed protein product [Callosobruchus analis]
MSVQLSADMQEFFPKDCLSEAKLQADHQLGSKPCHPASALDARDFNTLNNALARCPHCRKVSSVGPDYARGRGNIFMVLALIFLMLGISVSAATYAFARSHAGMYVLYVGAFLMAIILFVRGLYYYFMKVSIIEGPM